MRFLPFARLLRLPNVFTALADIGLGAAVTLAIHGWGGERLGRLLLLAAASGSLYLAGMVWNDWFDFDEDSRDRPFRPLPAGQVRPQTAFLLGALLLVVGLACAFAAGFSEQGFSERPLVIASLLVGAILAYDARLKRYLVGPIAMGACRFLNVLLGLSLLEPQFLRESTRLHLAATIGVYIVGITWFARHEASRSSPRRLAAALTLVAAAIVSALTLPMHVPLGTSSDLFPFLMGAFVYALSPPLLAALRSPEPKNVQAGVKRMILGLIVLDALIASVWLGAWGLLLGLLLIPALLLGKWVYST